MDNKLTKYNVSSYPLVGMALNGATQEQIDVAVENEATAIYEDLICDRRWTPKDVIELLKIEMRKRGLIKGEVSTG